MTLATSSVTLAEVVERARTLVPGLTERARQTEEARRVPDATLQEFLDAGLLRVLQPKTWGGYELPYGRTQTELCKVLGKGCGSSAWVQCVLACHAWCLAMFPPEAQDAVWGRDPDTLIASAFAPSTGRGHPVDGGYFVEGNWQFSSGSYACEWIIINAPIYEKGDSPTTMRWCLIQRPSWQVVDTWHAAGLKGTASNDIHVEGTFVPEAFTLDTTGCDGRPTPGSALNPGYNYRLPLWSVFPYNVSTPALGIAGGAIDAFVEYMGSRPERANLVQRQLRISESAAEVDAAEAVWLANAAILEQRGPSGGPWSPLVLAKLRRDHAFATMLCVRAVDRLTAAAGAHGIMEDTPLQRAAR
ncbi:MAG: acyl-CoA dehydrogenase, partial [Chloroflexi bacterium]|nr:acyl-CoA dehydrogenase [Chloroflexota bacterium]